MAPTEAPQTGVQAAQAAERILTLRLALAQARDTLERYRDPLVKVLDRVLAQ